jgi:predicted transcriptional regulator
MNLSKSDMEQIQNYAHLLWLSEGNLIEPDNNKKPVKERIEIKGKTKFYMIQIMPKIKALRNEGKKRKEIIEILGLNITPELLSYYIKNEKNLKLNDGRKRSKITKHQINEVIRLYNLKTKEKEISKKTGVKSPQDVIQRVRKGKLKSDIPITRIAQKRLNTGGKHC